MKYKILMSLGVACAIFSNINLNAYDFKERPFKGTLLEVFNERGYGDLYRKYCDCSYDCLRNQLMITKINLEAHQDVTRLRINECKSLLSELKDPIEIELYLSFMKQVDGIYREREALIDCTNKLLKEGEKSIEASNQGKTETAE